MVYHFGYNWSLVSVLLFKSQHCIKILHILSLINCFQHRDTDHGGVADSVVDHGVHTHRHRVSRENLASRVTCHVSRVTCHT